MGMSKFNVQYSKPNNNKIAVSDWIETITTVEADNMEEAIVKANSKLYKIDCYMILDIWEVEKLGELTSNIEELFEKEEA